MAQNKCKKLARNLPGIAQSIERQEDQNQINLRAQSEDLAGLHYSWFEL